MHYKRIAALIKTIQRAKCRVDVAIENIAIDVAKRPDKYSMEDKIRLWEFLSRKQLYLMEQLQSNLTLGKCTDRLQSELARKRV